MPLTITENAIIDYDVHGEGQPLILIGGLGFGRWGFFKQVPAFSRHFKTITFDVRGERALEGGVADLTADVVALLEHLDVRKAHVLGTSLGGFVAQELALERPDLVDKLVLVCTSYGRGGPETMSPWALMDMIGLPSLSTEKAVRRGLETATSEAYRAERPEEFERIVKWRLADSPSLSAYYEQARAGARFDARADVEHITSPTLVIHGAEDRYVPVANAAALAEAIPDAKLRVLEDAGHLVFIERFADVNREVVTFLKPRKPRGRQRTRKTLAKRLVERAEEIGKGVFGGSRRHQREREPQKRGGKLRKAESESLFRRYGGRLRGASLAIRRWIEEAWSRSS
ncbi:MAG: alpha/beta hydrolase [Actinomycetota bacterium]|nr:alpha/beta hydrolase [Actinomycetota bacterium]